MRPILIDSDRNVRSITFSQAYQTYQKEFHVGVRFEPSFGKRLVKDCSAGDHLSTDCITIFMLN